MSDQDNTPKNNANMDYIYRIGFVEGEINGLKIRNELAEKAIDEVKRSQENIQRDIKDVKENLQADIKEAKEVAEKANDNITVLRQNINDLKFGLSRDIEKSSQETKQAIVAGLQPLVKSVKELQEESKDRKKIWKSIIYMGSIAGAVATALGAVSPYILELFK